MTTNSISTFDRYAGEYDEWFDTNPWVYRSEVQALKRFVPERGKGIEIGVGTGRFSVPFGITVGVEPSQAMARIAQSRGITVYDAKAENLPFEEDAFDFALMVTILCFLEDPLQALKEIRRILRPGGKVIIGMLDKDSPLGREYESGKKHSKFYRYANFYSADHVLEWLKQAGFDHMQTVQTIIARPGDIKDVEPIKEGCGEGLFVVISASKSA